MVGVEACERNVEFFAMHTSVITMLCNKEMTSGQTLGNALAITCFTFRPSVIDEQHKCNRGKNTTKSFHIFCAVGLFSVERQRITPNLYVGYI